MRKVPKKDLIEIETWRRNHSVVQIFSVVKLQIFHGKTKRTAKIFGCPLQDILTRN